MCSGYTSSGTVPANFFSKSSTSCDPGAVSTAGLQNALDRVNYYRWLVGVPTMTSDATQNGAAQKCALISSMNAASSSVHSPPSSSTCYSSAGATSA